MTITYYYFMKNYMITIVLNIQICEGGLRKHLT